MERNCSASIHLKVPIPQQGQGQDLSTIPDQIPTLQEQLLLKMSYLENTASRGILF